MTRKFFCLHAAALLALAGCVIRTEHKIDAHITLDIRHVQEQLGHACLQTTQIYTHVSIRRLKEVHAATHPGAKLAPRPPPEAAP